VEKRDFAIAEVWRESLEILRSPGMLLASSDSKGVPNVMTIGWATLGIVWARPILTVLVRPSRFTYPLIEEVGDFTVNVPDRSMEEAVHYCGTVSGRAEDKFEGSGLTATPSRHVCSPVIEECLLHYECQVVHKHDLDPGTLTEAIQGQFYSQGDFHRVYYGEVLAVYGVDDFARRVGGMRL